jgi:hypothetical protein
MSQAARKRASRRRIQPYAWLGAGAVTLGMGAAMVGGTAVAFADTGADSGPNTSTSSSSEASSTKNEAPKPKARATRAAAIADDDAPVRRGRAAVADSTADVAPAAAATAVLPEAVVADSEVSTATAPATSPKRVGRALRNPAPEVAVPSLPDPVADNTAAPAPAAVVPGDEAPNMDSWLPGGVNTGQPIVAGAKLQLAKDQITATQDLLNQETWGSGNFIAGIIALAPQVMLATAQLSLLAWGATNPGVQSFLAGTDGIPLIHQVAQIALLTNMFLPSVADLSLGAAALLVPVVGFVGADVEEAETTLAAARQNGKVYAVIQTRTVLDTQPMVNAKINGGSNASLLIDTGASGLVTTRDKVGGTLGAPTGTGTSCFSGGICYDYTTYNVSVDLGSGAVATAPVNIVDAADEEEFKDFFFYGDGILGIGANTAGPGPVAVPTALMPGSLSEGVLVFQNAWPFGLGGYMILGPNPLPTRVSLPGAPDAFVKVSINDGPQQNGEAIIDSGGVFGTLNRSLYPGSPVGADVPAGTKISVYSADGATLLYTYTTQSGDFATPFIESGLFNTGNAPYAQNPIYLNYTYDNPYGIGSTDFSIW